MLFSYVVHSRGAFPVCSYHEPLWGIPSHQSLAELLMNCQQIRDASNDPDETDDLPHLNIKESKGQREFVDTQLECISNPYTKLLKFWKFNIRSIECPKMASIRDYWDEQIMLEIKYKLKEYEDLFPINFF